MTSAATGRFWWKPRSSAGQSNVEPPRSNYYQSHLKMLTVSWHCRLLKELTLVREAKHSCQTWALYSAADVSKRAGAHE